MLGPSSTISPCASFDAFARSASSGVSGVTALQSGFPVSVNNGVINSLWCDAFSYFGCPDNPNTSSFDISTYAPRSHRQANGSLQYFDPTPFSPEPLGTFGNTGRYIWRMPDPLPYQFYVKVEAVDRAGNIGEAITLERVKVDLSQPKAKILDIVPGGQ